MAKRLRVGLVGCGDFGAVMGRYVREVADLTALCDPDPARCAAAAGKLGLAGGRYTDYRALFASEPLDAVFVTAANFAHAEIVIAAAARGLHVFCEKIMARNLEECRAMAAACRKAGVKLMVGHKRRLRPSWARMIALTRPDAPLGDPLAITIVQYADMRPYRYPGTWWADPALSGGSQAVLCPHPIDWIRAMAGEVASVSAHYGPRMNTGYGFPEILHASYRFRSGALATINTSFEYPLQFFREAQGPMVQCRRGGLRLLPHMTHIDLRWRRLDEPAAHEERFELEPDFDTAFRREVGDFVAWIERGERPCLTWEEGLRCVELIEAVERSARAEGRPVALPLDPEVEKLFA